METAQQKTYYPDSKNRLNREFMKKKLLITASTFPRYLNDTEPRFIYDLALELNKYFDVTVLVPSAPKVKNYEISEGIKIIRYRYFPIKKLETLCYPGAIVPRIREKPLRALLVPFLMFALWYHLKKISKKFDLVDVNWIIPQGIIQPFTSKLPYLITGHGGDVTSLNQGILKIYKKNALSKATQVVVVSDRLKRFLESTYHLENVAVISMGCNLKKFNRENRINNYFKQDGEKIVLFVGRLAEKKGLAYLIEAMKQVNAKLIIVGDGPDKESLQNQASCLEDKIVFMGSKSHEELPYIYASSDIFCLPSIIARDGDQEGLPTVALEAMASGLPVVGCNTGGISEVVIDNQTGFLVSPKNSEQIAFQINRILDDSELYQRLSEGATEKAKEYDYEIIGRKYADLLENTLMRTR